jgi:ribose/xylose/arabinose/galactoside ABC-type transport system permease subunit
MSLVHVAGEVRRERPLVGHAWGLYAITSEVLGGMLLNGGGRFDARVGRQRAPLLHDTERDQPGVVTLPWHLQQVVTGVFPIVMVAVQTYLTRKRTY